MDPVFVENIKKFVLIGTFCLGGLLVVAHFLFGQIRTYLLFLGIAFVIVGLSLLTPPPMRWAPLLLALAAFVFAVVDSIQFTKARLKKMREEQADREAAFGEYLKAIAESEEEEPTSSGKPAPLN